MIPIDLLLEKGGCYKNYDEGEPICHTGAHANFYYQLVSGRVRWCNLLDDGKEVLHNMIIPGECFGELALFDEKPYAATARADVPTMVIRLGAEAFHEILSVQPKIHLEFTKNIAKKLRFKFFLTELLANNDSVDIVTKLIAHFNNHQQFICTDCRRLMLTRQELANMVGLRVETVIRAIRQMQQADQLDIVKGKVVVPTVD
ncbi:MAG: Crp/Fnr family transcriptional regulator [Sphingobacterium sp.]